MRISILLSRLLILLLAVLLASAASPAATVPAGEQLMELPSGRPGIKVRFLLANPQGTARGAVILLAGGNGILGLTAEGHISSLAGNQLVRTRADYAAAGYIVAVPDLGRSADGRGVVGRQSAEHANDLGLVVAFLHRSTKRVALIGTSNGTVSAANAASRLLGAEAPDAVVITSTVQNVIGIPNLGRITMPVLLVHHQYDACRVSPPSVPERLRPLLTAAVKVDVVMLSGGHGEGDPCEGRGFHGYNGIDDQVVATITGWLAGL